MINLVMVMFASGEGANVVWTEHLGQTAVVCDQSRNNTKVTSNLDDVDFLVNEACIVIVESITPYKSIKNTHQHPKPRRSL